MKLASLILTGVFALAGAAFAGPEVIIKQKAKNVRDQNNANQGVTPSQPSSSSFGQSSAPTPVPAQPAAPLPPQAITTLQGDLAEFKSKADVTPELTQRFAKDLAAVAKADRKPSAESLEKLAQNLGLAVAGKSLTPSQRSRLAQNLITVMNASRTPQEQVDNAIADVYAVLQAAKVGREETAAAGNSLKAIASELRKPAAK